MEVSGGVEGLDVSVLAEVLEQGSTEARMALVKQLTLLVSAEDTPQLERDQVLPVLLKLAVDPVRAVRALLTEELSDVANLNADLLFSLIAGDDEIALPFLAVTPSLSGWHMMAVLRVGDEQRQATVARRPDLTAEARSYIIKSAPAAIAVAMFDNPTNNFAETDLQTLYQRFNQVDTIVEKLLVQPNLPIDIRIQQAKRTASRMRQLLAERGWLAANDASELVGDAEDNAVMQVLLEASTDELTHAANYMASKQMLTPSFIVRAACLGEVRVVEAVLAHLSGLSIARVQSLIFSRGGQGMRTLVGKAGMPSACLGLLMAFGETAYEAREEGIKLSRDVFGRRLLEALMTRYEFLNSADRARQLEFVSRLGDDRVRKIAKQLKLDMQRAA